MLAVWDAVIVLFFLQAAHFHNKDRALVTQEDINRVEIRPSLSTGGLQCLFHGCQRSIHNGGIWLSFAYIFFYIAFTM